MSEMGAEQVQRLDAGLGSGLEALNIEPGEHGPAGPAESALDRAGASGALDRAPGMPDGALRSLDPSAFGMHDAAGLDDAFGTHDAAGPHDAGGELDAGLEIGAGLAEPGESGPAEPESGSAADYGPGSDTGLGRSAIESPSGMMSDISGGLASAEIVEPGEAGPAEAVESGIGGDTAAALHGVEAAAKDLSANVAQLGHDMDPAGAYRQQPAEALPQEQRTQSR
jgi:hypothetical protein